MLEVITDWNVNSHSGLATVQYFDLGGGPTTARSSWQTFLTAIQGLLSNKVTWTIRTSGRDINPQTGDLTGVWTDATARTGAGTAVQATVADASQMLIRWKTGVIVNSRFVQGRTFIPGYTQTGVLDGNLASSTITTVNNAAQAMADASNGFSIWARPFEGVTGDPNKPSRAGQACPVVNGSVWAEMAVLRRRRQ